MSLRATLNSGSVLPWVEKYRPTKLDDLVAHQDIVSTITKFISQNKLPHLLFYGPPGTGKTSTILAIARQMFGDKMSSMILELNASDDRGIDVVRDEIKNFASTQQIFSSGIKLVILDEADAMTNTAQFALRRVIERYTKNTRFCLICNYVSKIIPALQSRCTRFRFSPLDSSQVLERLQFVIDQERLNVTEDGKKSIVKIAGGDMRKVLNILQSASMAFDTLDEDAIYTTTGNPLPSDVTTMLDLLLNEQVEACYNAILKLKVEKGYALQDILKALHERVLRVVFPPHVKIALLERFSDIEYRLAFSSSEKIQLGSLIGAFCEARDAMATEEGSR